MQVIIFHEKTTSKTINNLNVMIMFRYFIFCKNFFNFIKIIIFKLYIIFYLFFSYIKFKITVKVTFKLEL